MDYLDCLAADYIRLRAVAETALDAPVPTCPDWTVTDLVQHVAVVYQHKTAAMKNNAFPRPWPPDVSGQDPIALLDSSYEALLEQFDELDPTDERITWYRDDQTVGFWQRRMTQETVIHRIDAELAAGVDSEKVPDALAIDGIDEVLHRFLAYFSVEEAEEFTTLAALTGQRVAVRSGGTTWIVDLRPTGVLIDTEGAFDAAVIAEPDVMLRWLWRRVPLDAVSTEGDLLAIKTLHGVLEEATQ
ncbi:maleylpyruvate isomerase family mycothiol-dependent enzyme [Actinokineospora sp. HUAS TT18]|uniref:maleylpyruvate isomerase family mycothiol-dependent enzyme n=1 Tax=Actinokineospora sp. HUAS TT18 TaxID=3447451 RepID=UPI003F523824